MRSDFPAKWRNWDFVNHKLRLFQEQMQGWCIDIAHYLAIDPTHKNGHSGFSVLAILFSYFENIAKFKSGYIKSGKSDYYFRKGIRWVYPKLARHNKSKTITEHIYHQARCGMYHVGITGKGILLECSINSGIELKKRLIMICPDKLVDDIQLHFNTYINELRNPHNTTLRLNFSKRLKFILSL